jgi:hypothetical protein
MKLKLTTVFCLLSMVLTYGQYSWTVGELHLTNGKTLIGEIKLPMSGTDLIAKNAKENVRFRKDKKAKTEKFGHEQVKQVVFKNPDSETSYFEYIQISKKKKGLFNVISTGKAKLYGRKVSVSTAMPMMHGGGGAAPATTWTHWNYSFSNFNEFYVLRENEEIASPLITAQVSKSFKKRAMEYFSDCPTLVAKLDNKDYVKDDVKEVVDEYNKCQ